ncbi:MAG TPA: aminoglycoside phosphotransferase family protein [Burkholderiaceae bacterium]|nr:aminoglycoside phosphotransferase family protein [Burkholderiaceae bacterium]
MAPPAQPIPPEFARALHELGLADAQDALSGEPLAGGVSSDIWCIHTARGPLCAKRALPQLRVAAQWLAPIERNRYEARWMQVANAAVPGSAPQVLGQHAQLGVLVMSYLAPADHPLWKQQLRAGVASVETARAVGATLGRIHAHSAARPELAGQFDSDAIFFDIRLEPYLLAAARKHAAHADALRALVEQTQCHACALVHGDVSPKNILVGPPAGGGSAVQPVLLDAECAWWGDPAFDLAFVLNHLLLKCLWTPAARDAFLQCVAALADSYFAQVNWEPRDALERRAALLLPGLLLARVDGKSPVEYITEDTQRQLVRRAAGALLHDAPARVRDVSDTWREQLVHR